MTRMVFGGTASDIIFDRYGNLAAFADGVNSLTFWTAQTSGTQYTDLYDQNFAVADTVTFTGFQIPAFVGPPGVMSMWFDKGDGSDRQLMVSTNFGTQVSGTTLDKTVIVSGNTNTVATATDTAITGASVTYTSDNSQVDVYISGVLVIVAASPFFPVVKIWDTAVTSGTEISKWTCSVITGTHLIPINWPSSYTLAAGTRTLVASLATGATQSGYFSTTASCQFQLKVCKA